MSTNTGPRSAARYTNQFSHQKYLWLCSSVDKCLAVDLKNPCLISSQGVFFTKISFKEAMNQMVKDKKNKNNNPSNSLVFGRWPQTKIVMLLGLINHAFKRKVDSGSKV